MLDRIIASLTRANTHRVCFSGVAIAFVSLGFIGGRAPMDAYAALHFHAFAGLARAYIDGASTVAIVIIWPAVIAAALGRPPTIPK